MRVFATCFRWLPAVALATLAAAAVQAAPAVPGGASPATQENPTDKLRKALDQARDVIIENQPLPLAINQLREETKINFVLDQTTLIGMGMAPDQLTVNLKLKNVKLRSALRTMLSPYHLTCVILGETVLISTEEVALYRQLRQHVSLDVENKAMAAAAKQLARDTGTNILVDAKVEKEAATAVTIQLDDVPLETAVRLLSEMVGLKPVRVGNVLYVTSKANANELRQEPDLAPPPNGNPNVYNPGGLGVPPGGFPGVVPAVPVPAVLPDNPPVDKTEDKPKDDKPDEKKSEEKKPDDAPKKDIPKGDKS